MKIVAWDAADAEEDYEQEQQPVTPCQPSNATTDAGTHAYIIGGLSCNVTDIQSFICPLGSADYEQEQQPVTPCQPSNATTDAGTHAYIIGGLSCNVTDIQSFICPLGSAASSGRVTPYRDL